MSGGLRRVCFRAHWDAVRERIGAILQTGRERLRVEDVYGALARGDAQLWCAPDGFVVLRLERSVDTGASTLFVWFGWCEGGNAIARYQQEIVDAAVRAGASEVAFCTRRRGFERVLGEGWEQQYVRWHRRV